MRELPQEDAEGVDVARRVVDHIFDRLVGALDHLGRHVPQRPHGVGAVGAVGATGTIGATAVIGTMGAIRRVALEQVRQVP
eukprot:scaffold72742_cov60-Phaeocystis_antarctica.AAC.3